MIHSTSFATVLCALSVSLSGLKAQMLPSDLAPWFEPPVEYRDQRSPGPSLLKFSSGQVAGNAEQWTQRREEILHEWQALMGTWPPVLEHPKLEIIETSRREDFTQHRIRLEMAPGQMGEGYLLIPDGTPPFPAVYVPFYDPETSVGLGKKPLRDFALQLTRRGFVSLSMGAPGGDARKPVLVPEAKCQPLSYLGYLSANAWQALAARPEVDSKRIGVVGHSYGGKWAMFGSCLWPKFACAVWSDPGVVFDETRLSINYWEPWYLGLDPAVTRKPGLITQESPRTG
ncbi:MAG TPA: sialidase, partial [Verrucomicrobium sp.]|nr:sialidase [Verrucomicrobium sp.]